MSVTLQPPPPPPPTTATTTETIPAGWEGIIDPGERILWQGAPDTAVRFSLTQLPEVLFGMLFSGFALFWMYMASMAPGLFWMFGLPLFLVGFGVILRSNYLAAKRRRFTYYTLTSRRAIVATSYPFSKRKLHSYPITASTTLELEEEDGQIGTILFLRMQWRDSDGDRRSRNVGFERIPDARKVYALMRQIQQEAK